MRGFMRAAVLFAAAFQGGVLAGGSSGGISGWVRDDRDIPLPGQIVFVGSLRTITDGEGRFSFPGAGIPFRYDLVVAGPGGDRATVYRGLTRRDPRIIHTARHPDGFARQAHIIGIVSGDMPKGAKQKHPRNWSWEFDFASARARTGDRPPAGWFDTTAGSDAYGPIPVRWDGPDTVTGRMMALFRRGRDSLDRAAFAERTVTLRAGETLTVDLRPAPVPIVPRKDPEIIRPRIERIRDEDDMWMPESNAPLFLDEFRIRDVGPVFHGDRFSRTTVDLRAFGIVYCHEAQSMDPDLASLRSRCGIDPGSPKPLELPLPVSFSEPPPATRAEPGMAFAWTAARRAVYCLDLAPAAGDPTALQPALRVCTVRTREEWPDLSGAGVAFPKPPAAYAATVSAMGPLESMDAWAASWDFREFWKTESEKLSLPLHPPLRKETADCRYREGVVCGPNEMYRLEAINRKLRYFPEFADAVRIHCVPDCAGARAFMRAYAGYLKTHPGFDADEPIEAEPSP